MKKEELLLENWKICFENIRFFRAEINKMSLWEFALFPVVGIAITVKFIADRNLLYAGITLVLLALILGIIDNLRHFNARYSSIHIELAKEIEKKLGTNIATAVGVEWEKRGENDQKSCLKKLNIKLFHINRVSELKYLFFIMGLSLILQYYLKLTSLKTLVGIWIILILLYLVFEELAKKQQKQAKT